MAENDESKRKQDVLSVLEKTDDAHQKLYEDTQSLLSEIRLARDVGQVVKEIVESVPKDDVLSAQQWNQIEADAQAQYKASLQMVNHVGDKTFFALTTSTTSASTAVLSVSFDSLQPFVSAPLFRDAKQEMINILNRQPLLDEVRACLKRLRLDERRGPVRSVIELVDDAAAAFQRPSGAEDSPLAVLLHVRAAFEGVVDELLKRRPNQEMARRTSEKVESIGRQCGQKGLPADHFHRLGMSCDNLLNQLSSFKDRAMPRKDLEVTFIGALQLLKSLLESVNPERFRNAIVPIRRSGAY